MELYLKKQLSIAFVVYLGQMLAGVAMGWTSPLVPKLEDPEQTPLPGAVTPATSSWIGSVLYIGTCSGPYLASYISNVRGRKPCFMLGGILNIFGFILLAFAKNLAMIFAGRIFTGLGTGIIFVINLVYIGEFASTNIRGLLLTVTGTSSSLGTLLVYAIGSYAPYTVTNYVFLGVATLYMLGLMVVPESPMFYILQGKEDEAKQLLIDLGRGDDIDDLLSVKYNQNIEGSWKDLYRVRSNRKAFIITFILGVLQQLSGVIVVVFFTTTIFTMAGSSIPAHVSTIIIGATGVVSSSIAPIFVERNGRRLLLLLSTAMGFLTLGTLGIYFLLDHLEGTSVENIQWLPLTVLIIFFLSYDMGFGIIPGTLIGEMFQSNVRSIGSVIAVTVSWLAGFAMSTLFSFMIDNLGAYGTFWFFSGNCLLAFLYTFFFVPETKGKSLHEIKEMLS